MFRTLASVLAVLPLATPLLAQATYTWNPASTNANAWNTTAAVWSTDGAGGPFDKAFVNGASNNALLTLNTGSANLTAGVAINLGQLRVGSDGFTLTGGTTVNRFTFNQGFQTVGGARTLNLAVGSGATTEFVATGTGDTSAGKLTVNLSSAVNALGINLTSSTVFGATPNADLIVNTTTGGVNGGTRVQLGNGLVMPAGVSMTLTSNAAGDLRTRVISGGSSQTWNGAVSLTGDGAVTLDNRGSNMMTFAGAVGSGANATALQLVGTGTGTVSGLMSGSQSVTKQDGGRWNLANTDNTFTGAVRIEAGTVGVTKLADAGQSSSLGAATGTTANIVMGQNNSAPAALEYLGGTSSSTNRTVVLQGAVGTAVPTYTISTGNNFSAGRSVTFTGDITTSTTAVGRILVLGGSNPGNNTVSGNISAAGGTLSLDKSGAAGSVWILTGTNTYSGTTRVTNGVLVINGNHAGATGVVTVGGGASTLAGTGTIGSPVTVSSGSNGATVRGDSGTGTGSLTLLADVTVNAGAGEFTRGGVHTQLATSGGVITGNSKLALSGATADLNFANLSGSNTFAITLGNDAGLNWNQSYTVVLATAAAGGNFQRNGDGGAAFSAADFTLVSGSGAWSSFENASLTRNGTELRLTFTPVPEPATVGLVAGLGGLLAALRRFRPGDRAGRRTI